MSSSALTLRLLSYGSLFLTLSHLTSSTPAVQSKGCYSSAGGLTNQGSNQYQTNDICQKTCIGLGKPVMGLTQGSNCYCGDLLPPESDQTDESSCSTKCNGYGLDTCGGDNAFNIYLTGTESSVGTSGSSDSDSDSSSSKASVKSTTQPASSTPPATYTSDDTTSTTSSSSESATTKVKSTTISVPPQVVTVGGKTVVRTVPDSEATSNPDQATPVASPTHPAGLTTGAKVGIAVGVIAGVVALAGIIGGIIVYLKRRNNDGGRHRRDTSVNGFVSSGVAPAGSIASDSRLDTTMVENRRRSRESVFADNEDYSRRILKVVNNPADD